MIHSMQVTSLWTPPFKPQWFLPRPPPAHPLPTREAFSSSRHALIFQLWFWRKGISVAALRPVIFSVS